MASVKEDIDAIYASLASSNPNFKSRTSQRIMVAEVAKLFWGACTAAEDQVVPKVIAIEAPTGSGKGLGYLIPGITVARRQKKKLIVSTATVKLQQQLCTSDLPLLQKAVEGSFTFAIAKGRRRYVCPQRLERETGAASQTDMMDTDSRTTSQDNDRVIIQLHRDFTNQRWDGDRDAVKVSDEIWRDISTDRTGCTNSRCAHYKACPFFKARAAMEKVDIVVANHDLVLSDLAMGGGIVLPAPDESLYCIDEAHHLPEKTVSAFAGSFQIGQTLRNLERIGGDIARPIANKEISDSLIKNAEATHDLLADLHGVLAGIDSLTKPGDVLRFPFGNMPDELNQMLTNLRVPASQLETSMDMASEWAKENAETEMSRSNADKLISDIAVLGETVATLNQAIGLFLTNSDAKDTPIAKWIEVVSAGRHNDLRLSASPVSAAKGLLQLFYTPATAVVLTSATLSALSEFEAFRQDAGLSLMGSQAKCISLPTPFDYAKQGRLIVPHMQANPKDAERHTEEVASLVPSLYPDRGGMLVLFPSYRQMNSVLAKLPAALRARTLVQGEHAPDAIIAMHREAVDKNGVSTIFGLQTMAEGVDLPREYCVRVVVTKLPFGVPTDPISATHAEWLDAQGRSSFNEISLTAVSRKVNQWSGRLIRTEDDWGDVIFLDTRLVKMGYGKKILNSLPDFTQVLGQRWESLPSAA